MPGGWKAEHLLQQRSAQQAVLRAVAPQAQVCTQGGQDKRKAQVAACACSADFRHMVWKQSRTSLTHLSQCNHSHAEVCRALRTGRERSQVSFSSRLPIFHSHHYAFRAVQENVLQCFHIKASRVFLVPLSLSLPELLALQENKPYTKCT